MDKYFVLTNEIMEKAVSYMPIADKAELARTIAERCIVEIPTASQNIQGEAYLALPYIKGEDREIKALCLMQVLLSHYLKVLDVGTILTVDKYDYYARGSLANQIERYKSVPALRDKAFDLLTDYKEFRKFVDIEINNLIEVSNDALARFIAAIAVYSTPDNIKKAVEELQKVGGDYAQALQDKKNLFAKAKAATESQNNGKKAEQEVKAEAVPVEQETSNG